MKALTPDQYALLQVLIELTSRGGSLSHSQLAALLQKQPSALSRQMAVLVRKGCISATRFPLTILTPNPPKPKPMRKKAARWGEVKSADNFVDGVYAPKRAYRRGDILTTHNDHVIVLSERKGPRKTGPKRSTYYWTALTKATMRRVNVTEVSLDCRFSPVT